MGLFDKLIGNTEISLNPQAGLLLSAITMVAIDGDVDDDELAIIRRLDGSRSTDAWEAALKTWKRKTTSECIILASESMNDKQRMVAIANLIDIAMADGFLAGAEKDLLEAYVKAFDLQDSDVRGIVDVISVKNNKVVFEAE